MSEETKNKALEEKLDENKINTKKKRMSCCKCMFWTFSVLSGIIACLIGGIYYASKTNEIPEEIAMALGDAGIQVFKAFDRDDDGYISVSEFEPMYHYLVNGGQDGSYLNTSEGQEVEFEQPITVEDEVVTVVPRFKPLELTSMMRDLDRHGTGVKDRIEWAAKNALESFEEGRRYLTGSLDPLYGLKSWKRVNKNFLNLAVRHFKPFFPEDLSFEVGKIYYIVEDEQNIFQRMMSDLSSNRYFPPFVKEKHLIVHKLLTLFHPRPFIMSRFKPRGSVACVRAKNDMYIDIVFRIHAEFQLNGLPNYPFWFTPAQFTGHLIVTRDLSHIEHFSMYVPADRKLNVDMEWLEGDRNMVVDIGYLPEMSAASTCPSVPATAVPLEEKLPEKKFDVETIKWTDELPEEEVLQMLKTEMYPFQKVQYYNMTESLQIAKKEDKFMHHIVLWGALDDQSC